MKYLWQQNIEAKQYPQLTHDISTDVLIIGGGMAGILTAHMLRKNGIPSVIVEANRMGGCATAGTTAVISAQHDTLYTDLANVYDERFAKGYLQANLDAVKEYEQLASNIDCDFEKRPSYMYSTTDGDKMKKEAALLNKLGYHAEFTETVPVPIAVKGAVVYPDMAQFHPLKFLYEMAKGLNIYEMTPVRKIKNKIAYTDFAQIKAKSIIVATHFPIINTQGLYFAKMYQQRSYVIAVDNVPKLEATLIDDAENGMYFRSYKDLLLIGGGDHRTGKTGDGYEELRKFVKTHYPDARERFYWSSQDCVTLDGAPYIGKYGKADNGIYAATGFNLWGMTTSMVTAKMMADLLQGVHSPYEEVFNPTRSMMHKQLLLNLGTTMSDLLFPTVKRCSHLGCALKWNKSEHSWDCPCHGSRYSAKGKLLNSPATKGIKIKPKQL